MWWWLIFTFLRVLLFLCFAVNTVDKLQLLIILHKRSRVLISICSGFKRESVNNFTVWPWPLTYDLDIQSQASQGQDRPSCQKSRSNGSNSRRAPTDKRKHTDATKRIISPAIYAVDKNNKSRIICKLIKVCLKSSTKCRMMRSWCTGGKLSEIYGSPKNWHIFCAP